MTPSASGRHGRTDRRFQIGNSPARSLAEPQFLRASDRARSSCAARRLLVLIAGQENSVVGILGQFLAVSRGRPAAEHPAGADDDAG